MDVVGLVGSICFAICGVPAALDAWRRKGCCYPWSFLLLWLVGEVLTSAYVLYLGNWILMINYVVNLICLLVIIRYNRK